MSRRASRAAIAGAAASVAAVVGLVGVGGASAASGSTHAATKTLKFVAVTTNQSTPTKAGNFYAADVDVAMGSIIAQDVVSCHLTSSTRASCDAALADTHGILDASFVLNLTTGTVTGRVTGGTRMYAGAVGTVVGSPESDGAGSAVTITYHT
jgi:hypothetical protein